MANNDGTEEDDGREEKFRQEVADALFEIVPADYTDFICLIQPDKSQSRSRLSYQIGRRDYPDDVIYTPTATLHEVAYLHMLETGASKIFIEAQRNQEEQWYFEIATEFEKGDPEKISKRREKDEEKQFQNVYSAREKLFKKNIGKLSGDIYKIGNVFWAGGGLVEIEYKHRKGVYFYATHGLTNPDLPSIVKFSEHQQEQTDTSRSRIVEHKLALEGRVPRYVPPNFAGYGVEILLCSPGKQELCLAALSWFVHAVLTDELDLFDVYEFEGMTIESVPLWDGRESDFLLLPSTIVPDNAKLPNGEAFFLIATAITRAEMDFAKEHGRLQLLERLLEKDIGQASVFDRESVI